MHSLDVSNTPHIYYLYNYLLEEGSFNFVIINYSIENYGVSGSFVIPSKQF